MSHAQWQGPTHTYTHLGPHSGRQPVLSEVSMARAEQCDDKEEADGRCMPPPPRTHFFFTFIFARGCFCGLTQGFDRRHPLPVGPLN